jgi:hypothetical protein
VERLLRLGATLKRSPKKGEDFVTLADPDGNSFDVINKKGWHFDQRALGLRDPKGEFSCTCGARSCGAKIAR